jgi:hypothetical protein
VVVARRLSPDQRQIVIVAIGAVVVAVVFVIAAIIAGGDARDDARPAIDDADYEPFPAGRYDTILGSIDDEGPVQFPDLLGGTRSFSLDLLGGELVALRLLVPGTDAPGAVPCGVQLADDRRSYEDCEGNPIDPGELQRFEIIVSTDEEGGSPDVEVDVRHVLAPDGTPVVTTTTAAGDISFDTTTP